MIRRFVERFGSTFEMHPELYQPYGLTRFRSNYNSLKVAIKKNKEKADSDSAALAHDRQLHPPPATHTSTSHGCYPRWDGSAAQRLLKQDVDSGLAENLKPQLLHAYRPEYVVFPLEVFRDHIHQERRARTEKAYWLNRK
jgi:hypothetical protein